MKSSSKFDALFAQRRDSRDVDQERSSALEQKQLGRPRGKRSHPDYAQVTAYIPAVLHDEVKIALIREGKKEFSRLVEELLRAWIQERTTGLRGTQPLAVQSRGTFDVSAGDGSEPPGSSGAGGFAHRLPEERTKASQS